ncbi:helix-turn-helix domain-containing protein [Rhizobium phaseoli]|uniref:helix-turn-helix domain-containing protein n=1 Tax=Rhizobium phaseoli TaxID=396 RepID=UPI000BBA7D46|nr:helix-turn-helix domain-containing protein [Rhizobium phaseoli]PCD67105.1 DNA-binding protein [Rhizobium phaseoli]
MNRSDFQLAALTYARTTQPLDPDQGWRVEDIHLAFMAGMEALAVPRLLSLPETARLLNVSTSTIHDLVRHGELAFVHSGRGAVRKHMTFSQDEIVNFIRRHTQRTYHDQGPRTARHGTRKSAHELAVERSTSSGGDFIGKLGARLAAAKAKKK